MKKFNKNILVFVFCMLFVVVGLCSEELYKGFCEALINVSNNENASRFKNILKFEEEIESINTDRLLYHNHMMDIHSLKENLLGTRIVKKGKTIIVKSDSESLVEQINQLDEKEIKTVVGRIDELRSVAENNGANFLYCAAPQKELYQSVPQNTHNYFKYNFERFLSELSNSQIPTINFAESFNRLDFDLFYDTDHHWTAKTGFTANSALIKELNSRYGFKYNAELSELSNYNIETFKNWFLGSNGRKVGAFFTWNGPDDFDLITPKFETSFIEEQPFKRQIKTGAFQETVLYKENMNKDYYNVDTYSTYSGGNFRLQIIKNNHNKDGKKILLIRDSFACVVTPFLALQTGELHVCDVRDNPSYVGDRFNIEDYIKQINPDYVLVLYTGVEGVSDSRYDFFLR